MTTKKGRATSAGVGGLETETERAREEGNWKRVIELAEQLKQRPDKKSETVANFLIGEAKLEDFLEEHPPKEKNASKAKEGLASAKDHLTKTIGEEAKKFGVQLDSYILLGKLNYAMANYNEALRFYDKAQLESLEEKQLPARSLKIMAEAFAIKAMCYEKVSIHKSSSKAKVAERQATILKCYEVAGDLTLLFLQVADKSSFVGQSTWSVISSGTSSSPIPTSQLSNQKLGPILEMALLKAPALNLKAGQNLKAIQRFRAMLQAEETDSTKDIRRNICWKLAEVLLHGISDASYVPPSIEDGSRAIRSTSQVNGIPESPWKPRRHVGKELYCPKSRTEEALLLLLLSENMARKEAILSQAPEFFGMRSTKFRDAIITYDLTTIALSRIRNFRGLCDMLEKSMKFSFNEPHTWTQLGLSLAAEGYSKRSLTIFKELGERNQAGAGACLVVSRMCYEVLNLYEEGILWAKRALKKDASTQDRFLKARCNIFMGIGYLLMIKTLENHNERQKQLALAEQYFIEAQRADNMDHLCEFYLAFHHAQKRNINQAMKHVQRAIELNPDHLPSFHLMILLLSARGEYEEALELTEMTLEEFPDSIPILSLKVRIAEKAHGYEEAILTAKTMLKQWQSISEHLPKPDECDTVSQHTQYRPPSASVGGYGTIGGSSYEQFNGYGVPRNPAFDALSDKDTVSLHAHSVTASHVEKTLSEVASNLSVPRLGPQDPAYTQMRIWLLTAEIHLNQDNIAEAEICLQEARMMSPLSYHLMFMKGLICEKKGDIESAKQWYENSLGVNPSHVSSLYHLGQVYLNLGYLRLSEQALKVAVRIDPTNEDIWMLLGEVKEDIAQEMLTTAEELCEPTRLKDEDERTPTESTSQSLLDEASRMFKRAAECQKIALSLHMSSPLVPFSSIPLCFE